jgi:ectoine hydroxylase-related dioxygenase (phytanoyl-CoA dioxygenase family)
MSAVAEGYQLHERNTDFVWRDAAAKGARRLTQAQIDSFNERGFCLVENAFDLAGIAAVIAAIDPIEAAYERYVRDQKNGQHVLTTVGAITFAAHIVKQSPVLQAFARHRVYQDICHDLIGGDVRLYWDQAVYKKAQIPQEFPWHQDNGYTFIEPQQYVTCWTPLVDMDEQNGCPMIAPGLHKLGTLNHWVTGIGLKCLDEVPAAVSVPAKAGDVIVFSSLAPHRTGPNLKTGTVRKAYILQYAPDGAHTILKDGQVVEQNDPDRQFSILQGGR